VKQHLKKAVYNLFAQVDLVHGWTPGQATTSKNELGEEDILSMFILGIR
jgi:hypothetical protein